MAAKSILSKQLVSGIFSHEIMRTCGRSEVEFEYEESREIRGFCCCARLYSNRLYGG